MLSVCRKRRHENVTLKGGVIEALCSLLTYHSKWSEKRLVAVVRATTGGLLKTLAKGRANLK